MSFEKISIIAKTSEDFDKLDAFRRSFDQNCIDQVESVSSGPRGVLVRYKAKNTESPLNLPVNPVSMDFEVELFRVRYDKFEIILPTKKIPHKIVFWW
jgi:hypothetical protein